jgi:hypothetical protein
MISRVALEVHLEGGMAKQTLFPLILPLWVLIIE